MEAPGRLDQTRQVPAARLHDEGVDAPRSWPLPSFQRFAG
jgi:hypothetical protein